MSALTINHILPLHRFPGELPQVLLIHGQAPGLCLQVLGVRLQVGPQGRKLGVCGGGAGRLSCWLPEGAVGVGQLQQDTAVCCGQHFGPTPTPTHTPEPLWAPLTFQDGLGGGGRQGDTVVGGAFGAEGVRLVHLSGEGSARRVRRTCSNVHIQKNCSERRVGASPEAAAVTEGVAHRRGEGAGVWVGAASPGTEGHAWAAQEPWGAIWGLRPGWVRLLVLPVLVLQRWGEEDGRTGALKDRRTGALKDGGHTSLLRAAYRAQETPRSRTGPERLSVKTTEAPSDARRGSCSQRGAPPLPRGADASELPPAEAPPPVGAGRSYLALAAGALAQQGLAAFVHVHGTVWKDRNTEPAQG